MSEVRPPTDEWLKEKPWEDDSLAQYEESDYPTDADLDGQDRENRLRLKRVIGEVVVWSVIFAAFLLGSAITIWAWHMLAPEAWTFLKQEQVNKIQSLIFSSALGAIVSAAAQKYIGGR